MDLIGRIVGTAYGKEESSAIVTESGIQDPN
jgi:hypothetical protein